jgi:hypothetical protein
MNVSSDIYDFPTHPLTPVNDLLHDWPHDKCLTRSGGAMYVEGRIIKHSNPLAKYTNNDLVPDESK